ncbi:Plasmodium exported protein, unknown function [Plasmodium ovale curtisi]|uniref:Uncharacterized protein n=1 Tax=Plasmodium ovale curtisi TaxID=864141 RepID=A0A1A8VMU4_PLAOA|nr:Plasmodium exported protein, unknown function [Plasmodium ovale curtisi]SBS99245.1 Plasmodium exported protein, unknown function [Plasmodium ovale curtisi]
MEKSCNNIDESSIPEDKENVGTFHKSRYNKNNLTKKVKFNSGRLLGHCKNHVTIYPPFERNLYKHMLHGRKSFNMKDQLEINVEAFKLMDEKLKAYELNKNVSKEPYMEIKQSEQYTDAIGEEEKEALKKYLDAYLEDEIHLKNIHDFMQQTENCRRHYVPMKYSWHKRKIIIEKAVRKFVTSLKHRMKKLITNFNHIYSLMVLEKPIKIKLILIKFTIYK